MIGHILIPCIIVVVIVILCVLPVGVIICYEKKQLDLRLRIAFLSFAIHPADRLLPGKKGRKGKKGGKRRRSMPPLRDILRPALDAMGRMIRKIRIDELRIHYTAGSEDPASAALQYGLVSAGLGVLLGQLEAACRVKKRQVEIDIDYELTGPEVQARASLSLRLWQMVGLIVRFGVRYLKQQKGKPDQSGKDRQAAPMRDALPKRGKEQLHGQASDQ